MNAQELDIRFHYKDTKFTRKRRNSRERALWQLAKSQARDRPRKRSGSLMHHCLAAQRSDSPKNIGNELLVCGLKLDRTAEREVDLAY
ncbi:MAG TPA: hypothetical protein VF020_13570 [Chthoniobacterales bacterium]